MEEFVIKSRYDGLELSVIKSIVKEAKANILIVHGMIEHKERYIDFINYLNNNKYNVYIYDKRGHGKSISEDIPLGFFSKESGVDALASDLLSVLAYIKDNSHEPIHLFAHSMGSIEARCFLQLNSHLVTKVCLCGTPNYQTMTKAGILLAKLKCLGNAKYKRSKLLHNLSVGAFNSKIENPRTPVDWLSFNEANVDTYLGDPLCTFRFTNNGFLTLFTLVNKMHKSSSYISTKENPIMFIYGKEDPCTGFEKGINDSVNTLIKAGFKDIKQKGFSHMRHEILNEENKEEVYKEVLAFYDEQL